MLAAALIVFREILEAGLVVGIVLAASQGIPRRGVWVAAGLAAGLTGAGLVAAFADVIAGFAAGMGQEVFNAAVMFAAVLMLGWHSVWMGRHGREMARDLKAVGQAVSAGSRPPVALAVVVAIALLREGSEAVLFLYGIAAGTTGGIGAMAMGGALGIAGGVAVAAALYRGLLVIPTRHIFAVTTWLIILLAAGMASTGTGFLVQADLVPSLGDAVWNSSALLPDSSLLGRALHAMLGYTAEPAGIQLLAYAATLAVIGGLTMAMTVRTQSAPGRRTAASA